jgi:hypothetical protein
LGSDVDASGARDAATIMIVRGGAIRETRGEKVVGKEMKGFGNNRVSDGHCWYDPARYISWTSPRLRRRYKENVSETKARVENDMDYEDINQNHKLVNKWSLQEGLLNLPCGWTASKAHLFRPVKTKEPTPALHLIVRRHRRIPSYPSILSPVNRQTGQCPSLFTLTLNSNLINPRIRRSSTSTLSSIVNPYCPPIVPILKLVDLQLQHAQLQ